MTAELSFEWLKMTKRWMPRIIFLLLMALITVAFWGEATQSSIRPNLLLPRGWLTAVAFISTFAPFFWPVLGGSWAGNEYGWGTIRSILTRRPSRIEHVFAALIILLIAVALAILAVLIVASAAAIVIALLTGNHVFAGGLFDGTFLATLVKGALAAWCVAGFYIVLSYTAGTIFRSAAVGIGIGIGATFAELIVRGIFVALGGIWKTVSDHLPIVYTNDLVRLIVRGELTRGAGLGGSEPGLPTVGASLLAIAIYTAIFLAITIVAVRNRDVTA